MKGRYHGEIGRHWELAKLVLLKKLSVCIQPRIQEEGVNSMGEHAFYACVPPKKVSPLQDP